MTMPSNRRKCSFNEDDRAALLAFYRARAPECQGAERERLQRLASQLAGMVWHDTPYQMWKCRKKGNADPAVATRSLKNPS